MMNKVLLGVIVLLLLIGALVLVNSQSKTSQAPTPEQLESQIPPKTPSDEATAAREAMQAQEETVVTVTETGYNPQNVTVDAGTKVVWKNESGSMANVSSAVHPTHQVYPPLNLGDFANGTEVSLVFDTPGTYKYHNHLQPSQFGTVVVK